jgi:guanylate kinase
VLEQRLRARAQDNEETVARRMAAARTEMSHWAEYDYVLVNEVFDRALDELAAVFLAARLRRPAQAARHKSLIEKLLAK